MMGKYFYKIFPFCAFMFASPAFAGSASGGKVTQLVSANTSFGFVTNGTRSAVPTCASGAPNQWVIDMSTPAGQGMAATVLTAFSLGKTVDIQGSGACSTIQPNVEAVQYVVVFP